MHAFHSKVLRKTKGERGEQKRWERDNHKRRDDEDDYDDHDDQNAGLIEAHQFISLIFILYEHSC